MDNFTNDKILHTQFSCSFSRNRKIQYHGFDPWNYSFIQTRRFPGPTFEGSRDIKQPRAPAQPRQLATMWQEKGAWKITADLSPRASRGRWSISNTVENNIDIHPLSLARPRKYLRVAIISKQVLNKFVRSWIHRAAKCPNCIWQSTGLIFKLTAKAVDVVTNLRREIFSKLGKIDKLRGTE